jgi:hypothetical protein
VVVGTDCGHAPTSPVNRLARGAPPVSNHSQLTYQTHLGGGGGEGGGGEQSPWLVHGEGGGEGGL